MMHFHILVSEVPVRSNSNSNINQMKWSSIANAGPGPGPPSSDALMQSQLQKSRTMSYFPRNEVASSSIQQFPIIQPQQQQQQQFYLNQNPWYNYIQSLQQQQQQRGPNIPNSGSAFFTAKVSAPTPIPAHNQVKRSKSFHYGSQLRGNDFKSNPYNNQSPVMTPQTSPHQPHQQSPYQPKFNDFQITKWPKHVQESITTVVTG